MIRISETEVFGWDAAIRGMRNPLESWDKSDTKYFDHGGVFRVPKIGSNDLKLMKSLSKAGNDHGKFLRMINVTCDITAPLYWWKEFDTYKVGTVSNSCSTMHKIHEKPFNYDDFSCEHLFDIYDPGGKFLYDVPIPNPENTNDGEVPGECVLASMELLTLTIDVLNTYRARFLRSKNKDYWWQMIQLLPSSYNQKRTVQFNYQVLKSMYFARRNHKLDEWHTLCEWMEGLPFFKEICIDE